jgi:hypothetical protein
MAVGVDQARDDPARPGHRLRSGDDVEAEVAVHHPEILLGVAGQDDAAEMEGLGVLHDGAI